MPELPEVETIKNVLNKILTNRTITKIDVLRPTLIKGSPDLFVSTLEGKTYKNISRIGKYLVFHMSDDVVMLSHLAMEGKYYEVNEKDTNTAYARVVFHLDNGHKICYDDSRCFGTLKVTSESMWQKEKEISKLGPEPFDIRDVTELLEKTSKSNEPIKAVITDQSIIAGIGNIYADKYDQKAFEYLSVAEDLSLETDDHSTRGYVSSNIANAHNKFNKPKDALKYYSSAVFEYTQAQTPAKIALNYKRAAELMSDYNNTEKAKRLYQKALHNAKKTDNIKLMQEIHRALQEI